MKSIILNYFLKLAILIIIPLVITTISTGIHTEVSIIEENPQYVNIKSTVLEETVETDEYVLGVTAGLLADWNYETSGTSEIAKMYGVLINTYMTLKSNSSLVLNAEEFDLNYLNAEQRKLLWGEDKCIEYEKMLSTWLSEVSGLILKSDGNIITPYFHRLSAGATRPGPESYLISVDTSLDLENASFLTVNEMTVSDFYNTFMEKYPDSSLTIETTTSSIQIISRDSAGYVTKIMIGNITLSGEEFSAILNLPSPSFTINYSGNTIKFITKGIGHGYGISLNHAAYLASKQYTYDAILGYFYNNIEITNE